MSYPPLSSPNVKTALVLAGGGLTGAVYEIGALRAIDDLLVELDTSRFDVYVGTSAGALVASFLANGITPAELMRGLDDDHPYLRGPRPRELFALNTREWVQRSLNFPRTLLGAARYYLNHRSEMRPTDAALGLTESVPTAIYHNLNLARYVQRILFAAGGTNRFSELERELYIVATDLDNGERAVFGEGDLVDVPISLAVAASSAVPLLYRPVRIGGHDYIDGGARGTASLDVAIEHGARLIVVVNSFVPLDNSERDSIPFFNPKGRHVSDKGMPAVVAQTYRTLFHAGLIYHIKQIQRRYRDVTIILIEPQATDSDMFFFNSMRYSSRMTIAQHGYESVTLNLAQDYHRYKEVLAHYGIAISTRQVREEMARMEEAHGSIEVVRQVMEDQTSHPSQRHLFPSREPETPEKAAPAQPAAPTTAPPTRTRKRGRLVSQLSQTLDQLETALDSDSQARRNGRPPGPL